MKKTEIQWDAEAHREFETLQQAVIKDRNTSKNPSEKQLLTSINTAITRLQNNPFSGDLIPRKYLTKKVINKYGTDKIFRMELVGYWRLLYTVIGEETKIIAFLLEYLNHKSYNTLFDYKKR